MAPVVSNDWSLLAVSASVPVLGASCDACVGWEAELVSCGVPPPAMAPTTHKKTKMARVMRSPPS